MGVRGISGIGVSDVMPRVAFLVVASMVLATMVLAIASYLHEQQVVVNNHWSIGNSHGTNHNNNSHTTKR